MGNSTIFTYDVKHLDTVMQNSKHAHLVFYSVPLFLVTYSSAQNVFLHIPQVLNTDANFLFDVTPFKRGEDVLFHDL